MAKQLLISIVAALTALAIPSFQAHAQSITIPQVDPVFGISRRDLDTADVSMLLSRSNALVSARSWEVDAYRDNPIALLLLGLAHQSGIGVKADPAKAAAFMQKSAALGEPRAMYELSGLAPPGEGLIIGWHRKDWSPRMWLDMAVDRGSPIAKARMAYLKTQGRWSGWSVPDDEVQKHLREIIRAADAGVVPAMQFAVERFQLTEGFLPHDDRAPALLNDPILGTDSTPSNPKVSLQQKTRWLEQLSERGDNNANYRLATLYGLGKGVPLDPARKLKLLQQSAATVNAARYQVALMYLKGEGVVRDKAKAIELLKLSFGPEFFVNPDHEVAQHLSGKDVLNGLLFGQPRSHAGALRVAKAIVDRERAGHGPDAENALAKAAEYGFALGAWWLAQRYEAGSMGAHQDLAAAFGWYMRAAELGNVEALGKVGSFYADGIGIERDEVKGLFWLRKGAALNNVAARHKLSEVLAIRRERNARLRAIAEEQARLEQARLDAEDARIARDQARDAAAMLARLTAQSQRNAQAWTYYRPFYTGNPILDAGEHDRAWQRAQASQSFFEYCRVQSCVAPPSSYVAARPARTSASAAPPSTTVKKRPSSSGTATIVASRPSGAARTSRLESAPTQRYPAELNADEVARLETEKAENLRLAKEAEEERKRAEAAQRTTWMEGIVACPLQANNQLFGETTCFGPFQNILMNVQKGHLSDITLACGGGSPWLIGDFGRHRVWGCNFGINPKLRHQSPHLDQASQLGITVARRTLYSCHPDQYEICTSQ